MADLFETLGTTLYSTANALTQPARDGAEVVAGLSEGQLRARAAARLGTDVVAGMATGQIINFLYEEGAI